ncbi:MAG: hypothetical protein ACFE9R_14165 [Candidatus Hermodarchaeota archaeon]
MTNFFTVFTLTPWDSLNTKTLTEVKLLSLKNIFKTFPVIEPGFFDDILSNLYKYKHYSWVECIKRIVGPNNEDYDITSWNFIWGMDNEKRMFQFLFQKIQSDFKDSQAILVALAPPELGKLFNQYKQEAILRTLSLLNNPNKMKFVIVLTPKGKSIAEEQRLFPINENDLEKIKFNNMLKQMPNIKGQWFPIYEAKCPICGGMLTEIKDYGVGFGKLVCPKCGYKKMK